MEFDFFDVCGITTLIDFFKPKKIINETVSIIKEKYHMSSINPNKFEYTPQTLDEYIGQENAKLRIQTYVKKIQRIKPVHAIINGTRGCGKSTLCYIIANMLEIPIKTYVGGSFSIENLKDFIQRNTNENGTKILFIDEIHALSNEVSEYMLPILQSFIMPEGGEKIKPFIMLGATTNLEILQKTSQPFLDRCDLITLDNYTPDDIKQILKNYNDQLYKQNIDEDIYNLISHNTRFNPRTTLSLFDDFIIEEDINKIFKGRQIVQDGLTTKDIIVLEHLEEIQKPVGIEVLAVITNQTKESYKNVQEPYLLQMGYISRTSRGRILTNKGQKLLKEIQ